MLADLSLALAQSPDDMERNAYNAAFYELGLRWHWDHATWTELACAGDCRKARLRHYLETRQAHLLRAYDAAFLVEAIERAKAEQACVASPTGHFDWSRARDCELGH